MTSFDNLGYKTEGNKLFEYYGKCDKLLNCYVKLKPRAVRGLLVFLPYYYPLN